NDYIKTAASSYPEMLICHLPDICMPRNDYFSSKSIIDSVAASPISSNKRMKTMTHLKKSRDALSMHSDRKELSMNNTENDIESGEDGNNDSTPSDSSQREVQKKQLSYILTGDGDREEFF
ncbi:2750_t:CDS:2, partial [Scutellospora calospora]